MTDDIKKLKAYKTYTKELLCDPTGYNSGSHNFMDELNIRQMYEYAVLFRRAFLRAGYAKRSPVDLTLLEAGCAWGLRLNQLTNFNFQPSNMFGIDIIQEYIDEAKKLNPSMNFDVMSATDMNFENDSFDFSFACVALSAMIDENVIKRSLSELCRVSKDFVLILDNFEKEYSNIKNDITYFKGVDEQLVLKLADRKDVRSVECIGSFWTTSSFSWRMHDIFNMFRFLENISYPLFIKWLSKDSHKAFFIELK